MDNSWILFIIVCCEVAFWLFMIAGLTVRYLFKQQKLSTVLLYSVPWIDVLLLAAVVMDLRSGSVATFAHGLAAAYIGFTVAFGRVTLDWADARFAHRFAGGDQPEKPPSYGRQLLIYEVKWFGRCLVAVATTIALAFLAIVVVDDPTKTAAFEMWLKIPLFTAVFWLVFGPVWSALFYWSAPKEGA